MIFSCPCKQFNDIDFIMKYKKRPIENDLQQAVSICQANRTSKIVQRTFSVVCTCLLLSLLLPSCKKWLDLKPVDGIIRENFWKTKEDVRAGVIGCYASLLGDPTASSTSTDRSLVETLFLWGEIRADMMAPSLGTTNEQYQVMSVSTVSSNSIVDWSDVYRTINYCNTVIDYAPAVLSSDKTLTQNVLDGYVAEAKAMRALMYFYLVRSFGAVPLKLVATSSDQQIQILAKSTQQQVLDQIVKDLTEAEPTILVSYGDNITDKGRITRYAVNAMQADVYLWEEKYSDALTACDKVIASKQFGLIAPGSAWFSTLYRNGNSNESIFEFQFNAQKPNLQYVLCATAKRQFVAANRVMDQVYGSDNVNYFKDIRGDGGSVRASDNLIWKFIGINSNDAIATAADSYTHWFVYRYADILLMKAEALAQLGNGTEALSLVQQIRNRAQALSTTNTSPNPANVNEVSLFILQERAREFMFEGKRWYDVLRYVKKNNYANIAYLQDLVSGTVPASSVRTAQAKMLDHNSHYFPISIYEIQTNTNLVQNPFYQ